MTHLCIVTIASAVYQLVGNLNCALIQRGTSEEILVSCRYAMEHGKPGSGDIISTRNVILEGMPRNNMDLIPEYYRATRDCTGKNLFFPINSLTN